DYQIIDFVFLCEILGVPLWFITFDKASVYFVLCGELKLIILHSHLYQLAFLTKPEHESFN
ncbi:MAG: hypothetical protein RBS55_07260, partial [Bacteroidales bacterium]|nr:hypothetical protein [Bacteroidales bacterium]